MLAGVLKIFGAKKTNPLAGHAGRDVIGIDFGGDSLKLAHMRLFPNRRELVSLLTRNIAGLPDAEVSRMLSSSFQIIGVRSPAAVSIINSNLAITKNIEIPSVDPREIKEIINLQAGRHTPYARDEIVIDYMDVGTYKNSYTKVLLVIVTAGIIKRQYDIVTKAGLKLEKILFSPEGIGHSAAKLLDLNTSDSPVSVANIDGNMTDFAVTYRNRLLFARSIPIGARQLAQERDQAFPRFAEELKRSLETYQGENIEKAPESLVITGATEEISWVTSALGESLAVPVRSADYLKNMAVSDPVREGLASKQVSFLNIIAPVFALEEIKISFVPEEVKVRKSIEERGRELIKTGIAAFTAFLFLFMILISNIYFKTVYLKSISTKYKAINEEAQKLESTFTIVSLVRNYLAGRGYSLEVLAELHGIAPMDLELDDIKFDYQGNRVTIKGTADSMGVVFSFVEAMSKSGYFKDPKTRYTTKRKEGSKDMTDFEIMSMLNKGR